jgi:hypothetical protein
MPHTAEEEDSYEDFNKKLALYIDSIVTNDLPINDLFRTELEQQEAEAGPSDTSAGDSIPSVDSQGSAAEIKENNMKVN